MMDMAAAAEEEVEMRGMTRERDAAAMKRRKLEDGEWRVRKTTEAETSVVERHSLAADGFESPNSEDSLAVVASISCCSRSVFTQKLKRRIKSLDLKGDDSAETHTLKHHIRSSPSEEEEEEEEEECMDATKCGRSSASTVTEAELEDFFMTAEKDLRNHMYECSTK